VEGTKVGFEDLRAYPETVGDWPGTIAAMVVAQVCGAKCAYPPLLDGFRIGTQNKRALPSFVGQRAHTLLGRATRCTARRFLTRRVCLTYGVWVVSKKIETLRLVAPLGVHNRSSQQALQEI
jgi:hypothetical protein